MKSMTNPSAEVEFDPHSSDAEHETVEPNEPQWRQFERNVDDLTRQLDREAVVVHDHRRKGRVSGRTRQVDVFVTGIIAGETMNIAIECKRYARRLGIGGVDEFAGKLIDLGVERGVLYALSGFTAGAEGRAEGAVQPRIQLRDLSPTAPDPLPWLPGLPEFTGFGDCPNDNCYTGDITWREWPQADSTVIEAGSCNTCGTWAVRCPECETETGFFWDEIDCAGCDRTYELVWDREGIDVERVAVT